jgi:uncharacterized membrane protein YsdA (DUF1294 family)
VSERFVCVDCGEGFTLSYAEQRWYREQGWSLPKRCPRCLALRRQVRASGKGGFSGPSSQAGSGPPRHRSRSWWARPLYRYGLITFGLTTVLTGLIIAFDPPFDLLEAWLLVITLVTFWTFGYDKAIAGQSAQRIPERVLLALSFCGGTLGAILGRVFFRHKTAKLSFRVKFWALVIGQLGLVAVYYIWIRPWLKL